MFTAYISLKSMQDGKPLFLHTFLLHN